MILLVVVYKKKNIYNFWEGRKISRIRKEWTSYQALLADRQLLEAWNMLVRSLLPSEQGGSRPVSQ